MGLYRVEGIVLANRDLGEADRIVVLLCREQGKIEAVARGARRPRNRMVGLTLPFNHLRLALFSGRGLDEVSQVEGIRSFQALRDDLLLLAYASYLAELAAEFLPEREPHPEAFALLLESLAALEEGKDPEGVTGFFALNLLEMAGFRPALTQCLACGRAPAPEEECAFHPAEGGIYCPSCGRPPGALSLPGRLRRAMQAAFAGDRNFLVPLGPADRRAFHLLVRSFLELRLEKELRSLRFLAGLLLPDENSSAEKKENPPSRRI
ncbi:MAG: DNA repair protein RecO [Bacillota bacterium]